MISIRSWVLRSAAGFALLASSVQAADLDTVRARMEVAIQAESPLDRLPKAPAHFFDLWERKSGFQLWSATLTVGLA